jgi:hypothetical protein
MKPVKTREPHALVAVALAALPRHPALPLNGQKNPNMTIW